MSPGGGWWAGGGRLECLEAAEEEKEEEKGGREMKEERGAVEELATGSQCLTEITLLLGLPDYSTALEDSETQTNID